MSCLVLPVSHPLETAFAAFDSVDLLLREFDPDSFLGSAWEEGRRPGPIDLPSTWGFFPGVWWLLVAQLGRASVPPHCGTFSSLPWTGFIPTSLKYLEFNFCVGICESHPGVIVAPSLLDPKDQSVPRPGLSPATGFSFDEQALEDA